MKEPRTFETTDAAVALRYDGVNAPQVVATGRDEVAEEILRLAREAGVPEYPHPELAAALAQIPLGDEVPRELYLAVARVIAFAYMVSGKMPAGFEPPTEPSGGVDRIV